MRVALLTRSAHPLHPPGGMERAVFHLARHLGRRGIDPVLYTRPRTEAGDFPGEVVEIPYGATAGISHGRVLDRTLHYPAFAERMGEAVAAEVRRGRIDVVDAQGLCALGYGRQRRADPALRAPLVMNPQGMEEHKTGGLKRIALGRLRRLSREAASLADRVIATDEATRDEVPRLLGVDPSRVAVVPNGVDLEALAEATPADPWSLVYARVPALRQAGVVFLSVGRLEPYKGFHDVGMALRLARAFDVVGRPADERGGPDLHEAVVAQVTLEMARQAEAAARPWSWVVIGDGPDRARLEAPHGALPLHVHALGAVDESLLHAFYECADVFVHAPHFEGSSLVTLEAMAHGLPVVATRAGGIPDKVVPGETGLLVPPKDVPALSRALIEVAFDPDRRREMGLRGRARVRALFGWDQVVDRVLALYAELREVA